MSYSVDDCRAVYYKLLKNWFYDHSEIYSQILSYTITTRITSAYIKN